MFSIAKISSPALFSSVKSKYNFHFTTQQDTILCLIFPPCAMAHNVLQAESQSNPRTPPLPPSLRGHTAYPASF